MKTAILALVLVALAVVIPISQWQVKLVADLSNANRAYATVVETQKQTLAVMGQEVKMLRRTVELQDTEIKRLRDYIKGIKPPEPIVKTVVVEKTVEVTKPPRWFYSEEELRRWLGGITQLSFSGWKCSQYAEDMMFYALSEGYALVVAPVWSSSIYGEWVGNYGQRHVGLWTWIGRDFVYVEPTPGGWRIVKLQDTWREKE